MTQHATDGSSERSTQDKMGMTGNTSSALTKPACTVPNMYKDMYIFFWDMTPCSLSDGYQLFGRTYVPNMDTAISRLKCCNPSTKLHSITFC